jgi:hypothetical protein
MNVLVALTAKTQNPGSAVAWKMLAAATIPEARPAIQKYFLRSPLPMGSHSGPRFWPYTFAALMELHKNMPDGIGGPLRGQVDRVFGRDFLGPASFTSEPSLRTDVDRYFDRFR